MISAPSSAEGAREEVRGAAVGTKEEGLLDVRVVKSASKEAVIGAIVQVRARAGPHGSTLDVRLNGTTDERGWVHLAVPASIPLHVTVGSKTNPNSIKDTEPVFVSGDRNPPALKPGERREIVVEVTCGPDIDFWGKVVSAEDGRPIEGATIQRVEEMTFAGQPKPSDTRSNSVKSDASGLFEIHTSSWVPLNGMRVQADGMGPGRFWVGIAYGEDEGHDTPEKAMVLRLRRSATIQARVIDSRRESEGLRVEMTLPEYSLFAGEGSAPSMAFGHEFETWQQDCDAEGRCVFDNMPSRVSLKARIFRGEEVAQEIPEALILEPGETRTVEWRIGGGALVHGHVTDQDGQPVADRELWLLPRVFSAADEGPSPSYLTESDGFETAAKAKTDADGGFHFEDIASGHWWLGIAPSFELEDRSAESDVAPMAFIMEIPAGELDHLIDLKAVRGISIHGKVERPNGSPARSCYVIGKLNDGMEVVQTRADEQGAFTLGPLMPGELTVHASSPFEFVDSDSVPVHAGDEHVTLRLKAGGHLTGAIVDRTTGQRVRASLCYSNRDRETHHLSLDGEVDSFNFKGMCPGVYDFAATTADGRIGVLRGVVVEAELTARNVIIQVAPGAQLKLKYEGSEDGKAISLYSERAYLGWVGLRRGEYITRTVPPGTIRICSSDRDQQEDREVVAVVGQEQTVVLGDD